MEKAALVLLVLWVFNIGCKSASKADHSVNKLASLTEQLNPDLPYQNFCRGYETLDASAIAETYTQEATLHNLYNGSSSNSFQGRHKIDSFFTATFASAKERALSLEIVFKVSSRQEQKNRILDNGLYQLNVSSPSQASNHRYGKFAIVLQEELGQWKFAVDANASATEEEFKTAEGIMIGSNGRQ
ncbi:MAG: hypothetical protein KTR30_38810 [Saprospiraceae bacterium]|nr:hypothetical protein [Saprospiraceae bacterium]